MTEATIVYTMTKRKGNAEFEATTEIKVCLDNRHTEAFQNPTALQREQRENEEFINMLCGAARLYRSYTRAIRNQHTCLRG